MSDEDLKKIIEEVDIQGTGIIHYHEFIAAIFPVEKYATKERLQSLFTHFDTSQSHTISGTTLKDAFTKLGHKLTEEEVHTIMDEHDIDHNHLITFEEFSALILDHM